MAGLSHWPSISIQAGLRVVFLYRQIRNTFQTAIALAEFEAIGKCKDENDHWKLSVELQRVTLLLSLKHLRNSTNTFEVRLGAKRRPILPDSSKPELTTSIPCSGGCSRVSKAIG